MRCHGVRLVLAGRRTLLQDRNPSKTFAAITCILTARFTQVILLVMERDRLIEALETLGELLQERAQQVGVLVVGGSSLLLLGLVERPTADVDVVGLSDSDGYTKADALPDFLVAAVEEVGNALDLGRRWLNIGPAGLIDFGLPPGIETRVTIHRFSALEVHLPARADLICFKLYAAVDQGERSKHFADLLAMTPTEDELVSAARWARTHDPSDAFLAELRGALALLRVETRDVDL